MTTSKTPSTTQQQQQSENGNLSPESIERLEQIAAKDQRGEDLTREDMEVIREQVSALVPAVNLDEVAPLPVRVPVMSYEEEVGSDGVRRRKLHTRQAEIETYVPLSYYNRMLADRERMMLLRQGWMKRQAAKRAAAEQAMEDAEATAALLDQDVQEDADPRVPWMLRHVWHVWRLSEPDATLAELSTGLTYLSLHRLFGLFFGGRSLT